MEKNSEIYFEDDFDKKYLEFIEAKNTLSFNHINLFYEVLLDVLKDNGENLKTWIGETNFRNYIFQIDGEKNIYRERLDEYIETQNISEQKSITLKITRGKVEKIIETLMKEFQQLFDKLKNDKIDEFQHPKLNPNCFNDKGYDLFKYLYENYYLEGKPSKTKLIYIWFFLCELENPDYKIHATKKDYLIFIKKNYHKEIKNVDRKDSYEMKHLGQLNSHFKLFKQFNTTT